MIGLQEFGALPASLYMIRRHVTQFVFWTTVFFSIATLVGLLARKDVLLIPMMISVVFNIWAVAKSERDGFVKTTQMRRAYEPARHFNIAQVFAILIFVMIQVSLGLYVLLT